MKNPKITLIGGGTGSFTLLQELKHLTTDISAIVNMSDDGGSTGILRDELGVLPPGDIRQCLVALSNIPVTRELFTYRFKDGNFQGHSTGNLILSALELQYGSFNQAVKVASEMLNITGKVIPVSLQNHRLSLNDGGQEIDGEYLIAHRKFTSKKLKISTKPEVDINPEAKAAIADAELIIIAPGNLYGSILPALVVNGVAQSIKESEAKVIYVSNLVTKPGQTDGWHVVDYVKVLGEYLGEGSIDFVIYNTEKPAKGLLETYASDGEFPLDIDLSRFNEIKARIIGEKLISRKIHQADEKDFIRRTLIRHDGKKVSKLILDIYQNL